MADTVSSQTITDVAGSKTVMKFTNKSDGTGESLVEKMTSANLNHLSTSTKISIRSRHDRLTDACYTDSK